MSDIRVVTPIAEATVDVLEIAKEAIEGVKDWTGDVAGSARDVAETARDKVSPPKKKKRSKLPLLLVALGIGALVYFVLRRRGGSDSYASPAPDAFGAAVEADAANPNGGRAPASTPLA